MTVRFIALSVLILGTVFIRTNDVLAEMWVDLEIDSIRIQPERPDSQEKITAVASIQNVGSEESDFFYVSAKLYAKGKLKRVAEEVPVLSRLPRLGSGLSVPLSLGKLAPGEYEVVMLADSRNSINERNEKNNEEKLTFRVYRPSYGKKTYGY